MPLTANINYSAPLSASSGTIVPGMAVVQLAGAYVPATAANLAAAGAVLPAGVSLSYGSGVNGSIIVDVAGIIDPSITGLGAGAISAVQANATTAMLERIASPTSSSPLVGYTIDTTGTLKLGAQPGASGSGTGVNAFTLTSSGFTMPAADNVTTVSVPVASSAWVSVGQHLYCENAGDLVVASIPDGTHISVTNPGTAGNATPGGTVAGGSKVSPGGVPGTGTGGSLSYTLDASSAALVAGDCYCKVSGSTNVTKATATALAAAGAILGVATGNVSPGGTIAWTDTISSTATGLGAGTAGGKVGITSTARLYDITIPTGAERIAGVRDASGGLTVAPSSPYLTSPMHVLNLLTFGAIAKIDYNPSTFQSNAEQSANVVALQAMIDTAHGLAKSGYSCIIPGWFDFNASVFFRAPIDLFGPPGAPAYHAGRMRWTVSTTGLFCVSTGNWSNQPTWTGSGGSIRHLDFLGTIDTSIRKWSYDKAWTLGQVCRLPEVLTDDAIAGGFGGDPRFVFVCVQAGYSSDTAPPTKMNAPALYADATATTPYTGLIETLSSTQIGAGKTPAKWRVETRSALDISCQMFIADCYFESWTNSAIAIHGTVADLLPGSNAQYASGANNTVLRNLWGVYNGGGWFAYGSDTNFTQVENCRFQASGYLQGNHGVDHYDGTQAGAVNLSGYAEAGTGPGFITNATVGKPTLIGCGTENTAPSGIRGNASVVQGSPFGPNAQRTNTVSVVSGGNTSSRNVGVRSQGAGTGMSARLDTTPSDMFTLAVDSENAGGQYYGFRLHDTNAVGYLKGWLTYGFSGTPVVTTWDVEGYSLARATEGPGHRIEPIGHVHGLGTHYGRFYDSGFLTTRSKFWRGGKINVGDAYMSRPNTTPQKGRWDVCVQAGAGGVEYANSTSYNAGQLVPYWYPGDVLQPSAASGRCFKVTKGGVSGTGTPSWGTATFNSTPARAWVASASASNPTFVDPDERFRSSAGTDGRARTIARPSAWTANTQYAPNTIVEMPGQAGLYFLAFAFDWTSRASGARAVLTGQVIQPTTPNGRWYMAIDRYYGGSYFGHPFGVAVLTGTVEPTWPTDGSPVVDGQCVWVEVYATSGATAPAWSDATGAYSTDIVSDGSLVEGKFTIRNAYTTTSGKNDYAAGEHVYGKLVWKLFRFTTNTVEPTWHTDGTQTPESGATLPWTPDALYGNAGHTSLTQALGFGLNWNDGGAGSEPATAIITDGTAQYTYFANAAVFAQTERLVLPGFTTVTLGATATADAAGLVWTYEVVKNLGTVNSTVTFSNLFNGYRVTVVNPGAGILTLNPGGVTVAAGKNAVVISDGSTLYLESTT